MSIIKFKIDEKSLFFGMYNDYERGQTATVSTPLNQSKDPKKWRTDILKLCETNLNVNSIPEMLMRKCTSKTTSQAKSKIDFLYVFNNLKLDGKPIICGCQFAFYIKEETDEMIKSKTTGKMVKNTHLGRKKLHYPQTLIYKSDGFNIDNKHVLEKILETNGGFAYIVRGFECNTVDRSLNFITSLVGLKGIFLSSVFKKQKGVGKKLLLEEISIDAQDLPEGDIAYLVNNENKSYQSVLEMFEVINKSKIENGQLGENIILKYLQEHIENISDVYHTSKDFPTSPYDIEFIQNGIKKYVEVKSTSGMKKIFNMSLGELKFMDKYKDVYVLFLVTNVKSEFPNIEMFTPEKILHLKKEYPNTRFYA